MFPAFAGLPQASGMTLRSSKGAVSEIVAELLNPRVGVASWRIYGNALSERGCFVEHIR